MAGRPTIKQLRKVLRYDESSPSGLIWIKSRPGVKQESVAGCKKPDGRWTVRVHWHLLYAHRVVWALVTGKWPKNEVDHINDLSNVFTNLREATHRENTANRRINRNSSSGLKGVYLDRVTGKWRAQIRIDGKARSLGYFTEKEDAQIAYWYAARAAFGAFARER